MKDRRPNWQEGWKQLHKVVNHALDTSDHVVDCRDDRDVSPLWKHYVRGYVACHLHLETTVGGEILHSHELCIDFQVLPLGWEHLRPFERTGAFEGAPFNGQYCGPGKNWCENLVFISVGKLAKETEGALPIPSLVGLRTLDDCPLTVRDFAEAFPLLGEPLASTLNRELNAVGFPSWFRHSDVAKIELPEQMIEGAAEVVNHVPTITPTSRRQSSGIAATLKM